MVVERSFGHVGRSQNRIDAGTLESRSVDLPENLLSAGAPACARDHGACASLDHLTYQPVCMQLNQKSTTIDP